MAVWRIITLAFAASIFVEAKLYHHQKRETAADICDLTYNNSTKVQCYCVTDSRYPNTVRGAECHLTKKGVQIDDKSWEGFDKLRDATKLTFSNTRGISLNYIPTNVFLITPKLLKVEIKFGNIETLQPFAFANLTLLENIILSDNQIKVLSVNAFAHHRDLAFISLDSNEIVEINRNVFVDLPSLEKLFLTNNKITTIHDKAFIHLINLEELEMDRNSLFSLNSETFSGLRKLERLDLSGNSLEVIGDNTFLPLINLKSLNLQGNKIQMLDEKAFHGLSNLVSLSLAHNNLTTLENVKIFEGLPNLTMLNLKSNQLTELKAEVMAPILSNFYGSTSNLDVEDNNMPCDCRLEWFMALMNKTQTPALKLALENLKCNPSDKLKEQWSSIAEADNTTDQVFEEDGQEPNGNFEYYDEVQLGGKLFYTDIRGIANCTKKADDMIPVANEVATQRTTVGINRETNTKAGFTSHTTPKTTISTAIMSTKLLITSTTVKPAEAIENKSAKAIDTNNKDIFTTVRLATVSAKPMKSDSNLIDQDMASDQARPEIKAQRSTQEEQVSNYKGNNAFTNVSDMFVVVITLCFRLCF